MRRCFASFLLSITLMAVQALAAADAPWRSALYPVDWNPSLRDAQGRFLHDFSFAGYHRGEAEIPLRSGPVKTATQSPYFADPTGKQDAGPAIQRALDDAGRAGGGVVFLPPGTYRLVLGENGPSNALTLSNSGVVLRGAGAAQTRLLLEAATMRERNLLALQAPAPPLWQEVATGPGFRLAVDAPNGSTEFTLEALGELAIGDRIYLRMDLAEPWISQLGMQGKWKPSERGSWTPFFCRTIAGIDPAKKTIRIDIPIRTALRCDANARVEKPGAALISEVGAEDFSIGMVQLPGEGLAEWDHPKPGTIAYAANRGCGLLVYGVENAWLRNIATFRPPGNKDEVHLISCGIRLVECRLVTVDHCRMGYPQYHGGGGDGYLFQLRGQENLLVDCVAESGRHNYTFGSMAASGNVIRRCVGKNGMLSSDFHMYLSMANLIDGHTFDKDCFEAKYRPYGAWGGAPMHGVTTTETVFWNCQGLGYPEAHFTVSANKVVTPPPVIIQSKQVGAGYVIGTRGPAPDIETGENEFVEGIGKGETLVPPSLYEAQKTRRLGGR